MKFKLLNLLLLVIGVITVNASDLYNITVIDGDTIAFTDGDRRIRVRLYAIDAPELDQPFGEDAKTYLYNLIKSGISEGKSINTMKVTTDAYDRVVGMLYIGDDCINVKMVLAGYAWHYPETKPVSNDFKMHQEYAQIRRIGIWKSPDNITPWEWRKHKREQKVIESDFFIPKFPLLMLYK